MPFGWEESHDAYQQAYTNGQPNKAKLSHELLAGGAAFAGFKAFEDHQRAEGKPVSHQFAKELLAGFAGAEIDKLAETKGEDFIDKERAKHEAKKHAEHMYEEHYERGYGADQYNPNQYRPHERYEQWDRPYESRRERAEDRREERREEWEERREEREERREGRW